MFMKQFMPLDGLDRCSRTYYEQQLESHRNNINVVLLRLEYNATDEVLIRSVRRVIDTFKGLKLSVFHAARINLRASYIVYNNTARESNQLMMNLPAAQQLHQLMRTRLRFLDILRERLSILLSVETVHSFLNPPDSFKFLLWSELTEKRATAMAMSDHRRLGARNTFGREIPNELYEYIWNFSKQKFNAKKYCRFVMAFPIGNSRLHGWMQRSAVIFTIVDDGYVQDAQEIANESPDPSTKSTPESDFGDDEEQRLANGMFGVVFPRRLFPTD